METSVSVFPKGFLKISSPIVVTSLFGMRKLNGEILPHKGIDFRMKVGSKLTSPVNGKVIQAGISNGGGLTLRIYWHIDAHNIMEVVFMHLSEIDKGIIVGSNVVVGQTIGKSGGAIGSPNSGDSKGPHLHFEVRFNNHSINPLDFLSNENLIASDGRIVGKHKNYSSFSQAPGSPNNVKIEDFQYVNEFPYSKSNDVTIEGETEVGISKDQEIKDISTIAKERLAPGIWQIIKLLVDSSVNYRQVQDSGISSQSGSIINFFKKVCQEPLVELMSDTYGDQFYFIVRKPPFDSEGMRKMINLTAIPIESDNLLSTSLNWNAQGIYSWYQYLPVADLLTSKIASFLLPAIFFPEYASIWGSRPLSVESNYFCWMKSGNHDPLLGQNKTNSDNIVNNAVRDLKYLIESNAYTPFTRSGTITLNGDRRYKRGTFVLHTSGEIFHIDAVSQSADINMQSSNRRTVLTVSHGMYPDFILGRQIDGKLYSYFNIIDFGDLESDKIDSINFKKLMSKWKVNADVFKFFLSKQQLAWERIK